MNKAEFQALVQMLKGLSDTERTQLLTEVAKPGANKPYTTARNTESYLKEIKYQDGRINTCPHCGSKHIVKHGFTTSNRYQRFRCKDCKKTLTFTKNTILYATKKSLYVWEKYLHCMMSYMSIRKTAVICGICYKPRSFGDTRFWIACRACKTR